MKLFFSPTSPYVRKCLVVAHELGLDGRIALLPANAHPVNRDATLVASNPLGKVPTFVTDDGQVLYDSRVICEYLNDFAKGGLFPAGAARWQALTLHALADGMLDAALLARYEDAVRPEVLRWTEWRAGQVDKVETSLANLEANAVLLNDRLDIGSLALACALGYLDLRYADLGWRNRYAQVAAWYAVFSQRPSLQTTWAIA